MIIDVFGMKVPIIFKEGLLDETGNFGEYDYNDKIIEIDDSLTTLETNKTVYHELLHALFDRTGVSDYFGDKDGRDMEHLIITVIEQFMFETYEIHLKKNQE